jgi:hypothetical protein
MPHGHVEAILLTIRKLGLDSIRSAKPARECQFGAAHVGRTHPARRFQVGHHATLAQHHVGRGVGRGRSHRRTEDNLYRAMDWLLARQDRIEKKPAEQHLQEGSLVLYNVSSSYYEGPTCPLAH